MRMRKAVLLAVLLLSACAPQVGGPLGEVDLASALSGSGTYRGSEPLPSVALSSLTSPDPRVREEAFALLRRQRAQAGEAGPEFMYLYGAYHLASGDYGQAAFYFNLGLRSLYPYAFDRQGRDVWDYGYGRASAYLHTEPQKALRDAVLLAEKAPPPAGGRMPKALLALELRVRALLALKGYEEALKAAEDYFRTWSGLPTPYLEGQRAFWRVALLRAEALEGLGRLEEARKAYAAILTAREKLAPVEEEVLRKARERLAALQP